jgi:hypothetical protein
MPHILEGLIWGEQVNLTAGYLTQASTTDVRIGYGAKLISGQGYT